MSILEQSTENNRVTTCKDYGLAATDATDGCARALKIHCWRNVYIFSNCGTLKVSSIGFRSYSNEIKVSVFTDGCE
jgi:hypothetical protein